MQTTARLAPVPRLAWLALVVLALALAFGAAILTVGSRSHQLPAPFGPARNGTLLYGSSDGDVYAYDVATGTSRAVVTGPAQDAWPWFSRDGTRIKLERQTGVSGQIDVMVGNADGSGLRPVVSALSNATSMDWTADGSTFAIVGDIAGVHGAYIVDADGSTPPRRLDAGAITIDAMEFRPDGRELVLTTTEGATHGLYAIHPDGTGLRPIATSKVEFGGEMLSPDGTKVAYTDWDPDRPVMGVLHVVDVDTGIDSIPQFDGERTGTADESPMWAPDSARLVFDRYWGGYYHVAVAPIAGGHVTEIGPAYIQSSHGDDKQFSPDGKDVIVTYQEDGATWLLDATGGAQKQLPASLMNGASWQRLGS
jgi:Tol biopolymer transport system component